ncbi:MAG: DUF58 domain-containing protein [Sedimenticola sp.]|nr:DUF58 domain-containing protein [Sedimenticola sp.]
MRLNLPDRFIRRCHSNKLGEATIGRQQIYIIPTRYGFGFALLLMLMWIGSINYANNLGLMLTFLLAGLAVVTMLHTWRNLLGLSFRVSRASQVFKGETACFYLQLINPRSDERPTIGLHFKNGDVIYSDLPPDCDQQVKLCITTERRGRLSIPRVQVFTTYPLGLFYAWSYLDLSGEALVYPAPGPRPQITNLPSYQLNAQGDKGVGADDFVGLRSYRPGDSPRQIDWKAQAREQGLHTKQFGGDRADLCWLEWDHYPHLGIEARLSALCRGVLDAVEQQQAFGLRLPNLTLKPARGETQRQAALRALALFAEAEQ